MSVPWPQFLRSAVPFATGAGCWIASLLTGAGLLGLALATAERRRRAPALPPPGGTEKGTVTVLLPVRDEESNIAACLDTLLAQSALPWVRVIDDGSSDATAGLVAARAALEPRLSLLAAGPLPPGWRGKLHALWVGSQGVTTPWLLATDADTRHDPDLLTRALAAADRWGLDAVSLAGLQGSAGIYQHLLVPLVYALLDGLLGDWREAASSGGPPVANGQFLLLRRQPWESCGGFAAVRGEAIDDVAVVARLRQHGFRSGFFRALDLLRVRMYPGPGAAARAWRRNLGGLLGPRPATVLAALAVLAAPAAVAVYAIASGCLGAGALLWGAGAASSAIVRSGCGHRPGYGLLYPLDTLLLAWVLARGALDLRRGQLRSWKGREMKV